MVAGALGLAGGAGAAGGLGWVVRIGAGFTVADWFPPGRVALGQPGPAVAPLEQAPLGLTPRWPGIELAGRGSCFPDAPGWWPS
ncbi:hypothetical protein [Austwickia chelonae]|uniref:hypothetical protein n=1 Tax=Austwickia chelonae TaxID=100225 RepID=UPI0013C3500C|nr:hypothetical protein [Austwickia chelonae]